MNEGFLSIPIHLEKEGSLWVPTYSPKYDLLGILLFKILIRQNAQNHSLKQRQTMSSQDLRGKSGSLQSNSKHLGKTYAQDC